MLVSQLGVKAKNYTVKIMTIIILSYKKYGREVHEAKQKKQSGC